MVGPAPEHLTAPQIKILYFSLGVDTFWQRFYTFMQVLLYFWGQTGEQPKEKYEQKYNNI